MATNKPIRSNNFGLFDRTWHTQSRSLIFDDSVFAIDLNILGRSILFSIVTIGIDRLISIAVLDWIGLDRLAVF